jgi:hypothetical protein
MEIMRQKKKKDTSELSREKRRYIRLEKGRNWLLRDNNLNKPHLVSRYRKFMRLDLTTAMRDLEELGARYNGGDEQSFHFHQESLQHDLAMAPYAIYMENSNDDFSCIAGYTSGGVPFGVTWEEAGIDPDLPYDEKVRLYAEQMEQPYADTDDLPF